LLNKEHLENVLHQKGLSKTKRLLICLAVDPVRPKKVQEIKDLGRDDGRDYGERSLEQDNSRLVLGEIPAKVKAMEM